MLILVTPIICALLIDLARSFPQGAPSEVCQLFSPARGHHGARAQPLDKSPYHFIQYARNYQPGDLIGVEIISKREEQTFRGFIVQAIDAQSLEFIGHFLEGEGLRLLPECSAVTHENSRDKSAAALVWMAPRDRKAGQVIFRATIVTNKHTFYENQVAQYVRLPTLDEESDNQDHRKDNQIKSC